MNQQRLLAVDDEPINLEIIGEYFDGSGLVVDFAEGGEAAWLRLDAGEAYDAIIVDRMMPGLDGIGLLQRIKADPRFRDIPVIMQTAAGGPEQVREGLAAGAHYYLVKPYARESLQAVVRGALADAGLRHELARQIAANASALNMLIRGSFELRSLTEASALAGLLAQACPVPDSAALALSELLINAVEHGNLGISYEEKSSLRRDGRWEDEIAARAALPENAGKSVRVEYERCADGIRFRIEDQGRGFDWAKYIEFDPARAFDPNGRGIALARMSAGVSIEYAGCGNAVTLQLTRPEQ